jgi:hypothetical protein
MINSSVDKGSISAPTATWLYMPQIIEVSASLSGYWHPNADPGASTAGRGILHLSIAKPL